MGFRPKIANYAVETATDPPQEDPKLVTVISGAMTFSTGIFLTLVRLYEPLFRVIILQNIYQFFGKVYVHKSKDFENIE